MIKGEGGRERTVRCFGLSDGKDRVATIGAAGGAGGADLMVRLGTEFARIGCEKSIKKRCRLGSCICESGFGARSELEAKTWEWSAQTRCKIESAGTVEKRPTG